MEFTFYVAEGRNSKLYAYKLPQAHQHTNIFLNFTNMIGIN